MLSIHIWNWCVCSENASVPYTYALGTHRLLTHMLWVRISSWRILLGCVSVPGVFALYVLKGPFQISYVGSVQASVPDAYAQCTHQFLTCVLSTLISSWPVCSVRVFSSWPVCSAYASNPDTYDQCTHQFLTHMLSTCIKVRAYAWVSQYFY